ncbi:PEP/pyruvate-binding domain-containing protein [uncultured Vibrio sp.]|uniref:PEP/pyruvate-binding domain-containing protein n=1 Tax=uncultured Vibrio sp. TaxID=114054 RepID=UPI0009158A0F|nr:PEP/pyruvate-binding domain-containing protein [uncultured Vibrio sp.]OIQ26551.1 MAG: hypothetical protein BM561_02020 [Vibrio sp. MedPE-SWchi]
MNQIYHFGHGPTSENEPTLNQVGGKAQSLIRSTKAGLPVPAGLALSVNFFEPWTASIKQSQAWRALIDDTTIKHCDAVKALAQALRFSDVQKQHFSEALSEFEQTEVFAVRSSSPEEDLKGTSFAGMYETFLGTPKSDLEETIAMAYSSMFDFRVIEYKRKHGMSADNSAISIIVQKQMASEVSGVGFSLNPLNNCYDEAVINASFGLGEAIVSGQVTPDTFVVDKSVVDKSVVDKSVSGKSKVADKNERLEKNEPRILESIIAEKQFALQLKDDGGIEPMSIANPSQPSLTDDQVLELTQLIIDCEAHYEVPVDTEWAYENGTLYLLQARPITTYVPLYPEMMTAPGEQKRLWIDLITLSQGFDDALSVLGADVWSRVLVNLKQGMMPAGEGGIVLNLHGRQYFQAHNIFKSYGKKKGLGVFTPMTNVFDGIEDQVFAEYCAPTEPALAKQAKKRLFGLIRKMLPPMLLSLIRSDKALENMNQCCDKVIAKYSAMENDRPYADIVEEAFKEFDPVMSNMTAFVTGALAYRKIQKMVKGTDAEGELGAVLMDIVSNPTSQMGHAMFKLASMDEVKAIDSEVEFLNKLQDRDFSERFLTQWDDYMYRYGARGFKEIDVATPRTVDSPEILFQQMKSLNLDDNQLTKVSQRKAEALAKMRLVAERKGKVKVFDKAVEKIEQTYGFREAPKYLIIVMNGHLHRLAKEIGAQWVVEKRLQTVEQIFDLTAAQISQAQGNQDLELIPLIEENLKDRALMDNVRQFPAVIDSRGKIFRKKVHAKDGEMVGMAVSNGTIQGKAKVLSSPYEKPLHPGEILVTVATEPAWTPVFTNAAGVVLEIGGGLQHGAIIAREYGLPCVSGLDGVTSVIQDGDLLEVDGTNGIVKILQKASPEDVKVNA